MNRLCDYAACDELGTQPTSDWLFCREHMVEHLEIEAEEEARRRGADYFTEAQKRLMRAHDAHLRRCWFCGSWAYGQHECKACLAPADRAALMGEDAG